jgi:prolyl-tRNA synthetase
MPQGLVMPPRVAPLQVIVIPIPNSKMSEEARAALSGKADEVVGGLKAAGVRVSSNTRDVYTPGWKYNHWEVKVGGPTPMPQMAWQAGDTVLRSCTCRVC